MSKHISYRIAYILWKRPSSKHYEAVETGDDPIFELERFIERNAASMLPLSVPCTEGKISQFPGMLGKIDLALDLFRNHSAKFDAYVATGEDVGLPVALASLAFRRRSPIHIIFHGHYIGNRKFNIVMKMLRRFGHIHWHPLSESLYNVLLNRFQISRLQCHNTGHSVDTEFFHPMAQTGCVIASAGMAYRDYVTLVNAGRDLKLPIKIAADGSPLFVSAGNPTAVELGSDPVPPHIEVRSYVNYRFLRDLYASASFVVVPLHNREHACGYAVIAEAMAMGKAVIATKTNAPSDFIVDGITGFYVRPNDPVELRARMQQLIEQPELAAQLGLNAREKMSNYGLDSFCERLERAMSRSLLK